MELLLFQPPLLIVIDRYNKTNTRDHPTRWFCRIEPSLNRVVPELSPSLCVVLVLLLPPPPMTTPTNTPTLLSFVIVESILNLI